MKSYNKLLVNGFVFIALNVIDVWLTKWALQLGSREVNPIMALLGDNFEIKVLASIVVAFLLVFFKRTNILIGLNIGMGLVILWNMSAVVIATVVH